jgi:hypothetical protein
MSMNARAVACIDETFDDCRLQISDRELQRTAVTTASQIPLPFAAGEWNLRD